MFRLECFVDDKHLAKALHVLDGLVIDLKTLPVRNAIKQANGKLKSTAAGSTLEAITTHITENKLSVINVKQVQAALKASGFSAGGYSTALTGAIKAKVLKKGKVRGEYVVVKGG